MTTKTKYSSSDLFKDYGALTFAEILIGLRMSRELTQAQFGKKLGISAANLCDLEKGRKFPSLQKAIKMARKLKISDSFLIQIVLQDKLRREKINFKISIAA